MKNLSLCMIVKNEEDFLEDCLTWHKDLVDEIIIVDTGSNDRTQEIARKFTDKIYPFEWCNDFSAARNYSLSFASGDWIIVLDADEKISKEDQANIKSLIEPSHPEAYQLIQRTYTNNSSLYGFQTQKNPISTSEVIPKTIGYFDTPIVRLIPNQKELGLRYVQRIHEGIEYEDSQKKPLSTSFILHHYGALKKEELLQQKKKLYYELEKIRLSENQNDAEGLRQYASACLEFEEWKEALKYFQQSLQLEPNHSYSIFGVALALYHLKRLEECENILEMALEIDRHNLYLYKLFAVVLLELKKTDRARQYLQSYLFQNPQDTELRSQFVARYMQQGLLKWALQLLTEIFNVDPNHADSLYNAGVLHHHLGQKDLALEMMHRLIQLKPNDEEVKRKILEWQ